MKLGIICYLNNNFAEAARLFLSLRKYDERCRKEEKEIWGSTAQRLAAAAKDEFGPRAENQYIRDFKGKKRIAATLGNFAYDALDFNKSEHIYLQLLNENLGRLSKNEKSYVLYMLGNIKHMQGMELKSIDYLSAFESERFKKTGIYAKALYTLCAIDVQCRMDGEYFEEIWKRCFPLLLKRCSKTTYAEKGLFGYAFVMERINVAKAINLYREYLKKYPNGKYRKIVKDHLLKKRSSKK